MPGSDSSSSTHRSARISGATSQVVHEHVDDSDLVLADVVIKAFGKLYELLAVIAFNESLHESPSLNALIQFRRGRRAELGRVRKFGIGPRQWTCGYSPDPMALKYYLCILRGKVTFSLDEIGTLKCHRRFREHQ
jgi:hypothetical protein